MARRLVIGIASYRSVEKLKKCVEAVQKHSVTDWNLHIVHNPHPGGDQYTPSAGEGPLFDELMKDTRISVSLPGENLRYAGAVNEILRQAQTEYVAYLDNDAYPETPGWDETLCSYLDRFHELGMVFPNTGAYPIPRGGYTEVMWAAGYCWALNQMAAWVVRDGEGGWDFDPTIGHQEEADYALRLRMAGFRLACAPEVRVRHDATATQDPASIERINRGVVKFVNKWCRYFGGKNLNYHSPNVLRWEDWPPNALYLEEYWKHYITVGEIAVSGNMKPDQFQFRGREYDLIQVPRLAGFYRGRVI